MKSFDKMDPRKLQKEFEALIEKTDALESLEFDELAKSIMSEDPVMTKYTSLIAKGAGGGALNDQEKEYLHVMGLLEKRDVHYRFGELSAEDGSEIDSN